MGLLNRLDDPIQGDGIILGTVEDILNWGRSKSDWYLQFGLACCAIEFMALNASHFDMMRFGAIPRTSPRQADFIIVSGTVTLKMADRIKTLYEQMSEPRYVMSMGSCSNSGGPYWEHGYHVLKGVDRIIPVDVYVPGCPPRPEAFFEGLVKLQKMISTQAIFRKREKMSPEDLAALELRQKKVREYQERVKQENADYNDVNRKIYTGYSLDYLKKEESK
ncbi:MAG: NADH-quinone oxidoreductase subunit B [Candidatus Kapabacteria bacterium]|nr:NADH-quinone oxidoreductase subunit B [Ignavibacteriota bacterium]MCW5885597.1 NADH-quinone oxidoreductase subunit B [Candidatus Kapabacteria bacterium]